MCLRSRSSSSRLVYKRYSRRGRSPIITRDEKRRFFWLVWRLLNVLGIYLEIFCDLDLTQKIALRHSKWPSSLQPSNCVVFFEGRLQVCRAGRATAKAPSTQRAPRLSHIPLKPQSSPIKVLKGSEHLWSLGVRL